MAKKQTQVNDGEDMVTETNELPNRVLGGSTAIEELEAKTAVHEHKVSNVDREAIDRIILSDDVQKGGKIRVERKGPLERDYQWLTTIPAEQWGDTDAMYEWMKNLFGGGDYKCATFRANGQRYKPFSFSIDYRFQGQLDQDQIAKMRGDNGAKQNDVMMAKLLDMATRPPVAAPDNGQLKSGDMIKMMEMGSNRSEQMMTLVMTMMMKSQETMATLMAAAISAGNNRPAATGIDPVILELLKQKSDRPPMMEVLEIMRAVKELNDPPETPPEKEETMIDKLLKFAPLLIPGMSGMVPPQPQPAALPQGQPGPQPQPQPAGLPIEWQMAMRTLVMAAERGADPSLYADLILDQVGGPEQLAGLKAILTDAGWKGKLGLDERKVAHIEPWLEELRQLILHYESDAPPVESSTSSPTVGEGATHGPGVRPGADTPISREGT